MSNNVFDFRPEAEYEALDGVFVSSDYFTLHRTDGMFLGHEISKIIVRDADGLGLGLAHIEFVVYQESTRIFLHLTSLSTALFIRWVKQFTCSAIEDRRGPPVPRAPSPAKQSECPVCYGTGFYKGFGAPCSKGCKA